MVFKPWVDSRKEFFIKRVIWMPWDSVKIEKGNVFLKKVWETKFKKLDEKYLNKENNGNTKVDQSKKVNIYTVPKWKYFVMWDNRNHSSDSRSCFTYSCSSASRDSYISKKNVIGKVLVDLGYFNIRNFSFTHPNIRLEDWTLISTKPKWLNSAATFNY